MFIAALVIGAVLVVRQTLDKESKHLQMRENFILLQQKENPTGAAYFYQRLMRDLASLSDHTLLDDYQRTVLLVNPDVNDVDNLVWKYHWAVRKQLEQRTQKRLADLESLEGWKRR